MAHLRLSRNILEWEWMDDSHTFHVFMYLLLNANYKDIQYHGIAVKRGQIITGRKAIAKKLRLSERCVRTALDHLKSTNEIAIKTTNKFSIVTICKFDYWQDISLDGDQQNDQQIDQPPTNNRPTTDQQPTTYKEVYKERIEEIKKEYDSILFSAKSEFLRLQEEQNAIVDDLKKQLEDLKAQLADDKKEKKKRAKPIPKTLGGFAQAAFEEFYAKQKGIEYNWSAKDGGQMKLLLQKIRWSRENRETPLPCADEDMVDALKSLLGYIKDGWLLDHLDVAMVNSKYNEIVAAALGNPSVFDTAHNYQLPKDENGETPNKWTML